MKETKNLLFVCEGNEQRSPTFEIWFKENRPQYNVKSAGIRSYSSVILTKELLYWADIVYVMDLEQEIFIYRKFPEFLGKIVVVGCSDQYPGGSLELINLIEYWANKNNL